MKKLLNNFVFALLIVSTSVVVNAQATGSIDDVRELLENNQLDAAFEKCKEILDILPEYPDAVFMLGRIYFQMGELDSAKTYVYKAIELDPANTEYREKINEMSAFTSKLNEATRLVNSADYKSAKAIYKEVINENPNFADGYYNLALMYIRLDSIQQAAENFNRAMELRPEEDKYSKGYEIAAKRFLSEGNDLMRRRNYRGAIGKFEKAITLNPEDYLGYYLASVAYYSEKNYNKALEMVNKSIERNDEYPKAYLLKGNTLDKLGKTDEAVEEYETALEIDQNYTDAWNRLGILYYKKKDFDNAISSLEKVIKLEPDRASSYEIIGAIYNEKKEWENSINYLSKAVELDPRNNTSWLRLAQAYNGFGKCKEAKESAQSALHLKPNWAPALIELGIAERCLGEKSLARQHFQMAMRDPQWRKLAEFELNRTN